MRLQAIITAVRKFVKYTDIETNYVFPPIADESLDPINVSGCAFLSKLGRKLSTKSGDDRETSFLFQRLSVLIQRFNAILLLDSFNNHLYSPSTRQHKER